MTIQIEREAPMTDAEIEHLKSWLTLTLSGAMHYRHEVSREALEECLRAIDTLQARSQPSAPAWVDCNDTLPNSNHPVEIYNAKTKQRSVGFLPDWQTGLSFIISSQNGGITMRATHWKELEALPEALLPPPPQAEEKV